MPTQDFKGTFNGNTFTDGTGILTIAAGKTLSYNEGTWTPVLEGTTGSAGAYASSGAGKWTRVGDLITATFNLALTNNGDWTGNLKITGLPVQATAEGYGSIYMGNVTYDGYCIPYINAGEQFIGIAVTKTASAVAVIAVSGVADNSYFYGQITYRG